MMLNSCVFVCMLTLSSLCVADETHTEWNKNWPHWRGPSMNGTAPLARPPLSWSEDKNIRWKVEIGGEGCSTPIVWGDRVFVLTSVETNTKPEKPTIQSTVELGRTALPVSEFVFKFEVVCYDRSTGAEIWRKTATEQAPHEGLQRTNTYASASPMTDGRHLYVSFGSRGIFCYTLDGDLIWKRDLGDLTTRRGFGEGASPFVYRDSLIVPWDHEGPSALYCLDANTGETKWKVDRDELTNWNTPVVVDWKGTTQVIVNGVRTVSYDLADGSILWECGGQTINCIPTIIVDQGIAYCMSGWNGAALNAISLDARGDVTGSDSVDWSYHQDTPYVPSALLYGDRLYFTKHTTPILTSLHTKTGQPIIPATRLPQFIGTLYASPVAADGRVYILNREGNTLVLEHSDTIQRLALNSLDDIFNASPALVGQQVFLRGMRYLYCVEETSD